MVLDGWGNRTDRWIEICFAVLEAISFIISLVTMSWGYIVKDRIEWIKDLGGIFAGSRGQVDFGDLDSIIYILYAIPTQ